MTSEPHGPDPQGTNRSDGRPRGPRRPRVVAALVGLALLVVPAAVLAADRFSDVPSESQFHDAISAIAGAGVTDGCDADPPRFCPNDDVSREQMAAFLERGLSRTAFNDGVAELDAAGDYRGVPASVDIEAGAAGGGSGMVTLDGAVTVYTDGDQPACPCEIEALIYRDRDDAAGPSMWTQLPAEAATGTGKVNASVPLRWSTTIEAGATETYRIVVFVNGAEPEAVSAEAALTATYVPFG